MSLPAIEVSGLSKRYVIEHESRHDNLRDTLHHTARKLWRRVRWGTSFDREEFMALDDVSFSVQPGEVVGIIGRNGAGKSTLLKILSRITEPSSGKITLRGRVASLLEVGTGFHPELTGRENIFLNGAILGMSRAEIRRKFDEIVAFAEVEKFLDTPVKRYSSGMYVRLAFAVAAHLDPEILIVDEVLAVGDMQFQEKCLGRMRKVAQGGRTVLFVSHNMAAMQTLCSRALCMGAGRIEFDGLPAAAVQRYMRKAVPASGLPETFEGNDPAMRIARTIFNAETGSIEISAVIRTSAPKTLALEFILMTSAGSPAAFADKGTLDISQRLDLSSGENRFLACIDASRLANGPYLVCAQLVDPYAHVVLRLEQGASVDIGHVPPTSAHRVLELNWQSGVVTLPMGVVRE